MWVQRVGTTYKLNRRLKNFVRYRTHGRLWWISFDNHTRPWYESWSPDVLVSLTPLESSLSLVCRYRNGSVTSDWSLIGPRTSSLSSIYIWEGYIVVNKILVSQYNELEVLLVTCYLFCSHKLNMYVSSSTRVYRPRVRVRGLWRVKTYVVNVKLKVVHVFVSDKYSNNYVFRIPELVGPRV